MSSAIAFQLLDENLLDPVLYAVLLAIKTAQRFLVKCTPEEQAEFLSVAATFSGKTSQVRGPASALKANLLRLGWGIGRDGTLTTSHLVPLFCLQIRLPSCNVLHGIHGRKIFCCITLKGRTSRASQTAHTALRFASCRSFLEPRTFG